MQNKNSKLTAKAQKMEDFVSRRGAEGAESKNLLIPISINDFFPIFLCVFADSSENASANERA
jgi:hypothetical protein